MKTSLHTLFVILSFVARTAADTFTVTNTADPGDGVCNNACTLREAIDVANLNAGADTIEFNIPGDGVHTIALASQLPSITDPVTIDGYSQPGASENALEVGNDAVLLIELDGTNAGIVSSGLIVSAEGCAIQGLAVNRFAATGIAVGAGATVTGNFIGTDPSGAVDLGNGRGVSISDDDNLIGGPAPAARNIISGNDENGVTCFIGSDDNQIMGNYIGTDGSGTADLGNGLAGVRVEAKSAFLGGTAPGAGNLISGNGTSGILVTGATSSAQIEGNLVGTDVTGTVALPNDSHGVHVSGGLGSLIGGLEPSSRNLISGNGDDGVLIETKAIGAAVQGNFIGTDVTGALDLGNTNEGVEINDASRNGIAGNTISGNGDHGVLLQGGASANFVQGNFIGTDMTGAVALGNLVSGVRIDDASGNTVGGVTAAARNIISGHLNSGVSLRNGASSNTVQGNYIGTDVSGRVALGNPNGVFIDDAPNNVIGGAAPGAGNLLSGNGFGVQITVAGSTGNLIQGNLIGTDATGTAPLGNGIGILLFTNSTGTTIGGPGGAANVIAYSISGEGVVVNTSSSGNRIFGNSIFANEGLGINLGNEGDDANGVTPNDFPDNDTGANELQNYPVISGITLTGDDRTVEGELSSNPNTDYTLDFYSNSEVDPSGYGEGETYLGFVDVHTNVQGRVEFSFPLEASSLGRYITATATDPNGNTSEFSMASELVPPLSRFLNISTRLRVQTGDNVLIGGFIIDGTDPKEVIVRAIGPSLGDFGVADPLANPILELNYPDGTTVLTNNNWRETQEAEIIATGLAPSDDLESAIVATLDPGNYTAIVRGVNGATGVGLVETYDLSSAVDSALANISTRGLVETGDNVMIGGIIVGPEEAPSGSILLRAIGPSLSDFGISNPLANPTLELRDVNGVLVMANDNWKSTQQAAIEATGLAPNNDLESAILASLAAGSYTAILSDVGGTTGIGLVEAYHLD